MGKKAIKHLFLILLLGSIINTESMLIPKRNITLPRIPITPQQPLQYHTKTYQPLSWTDTFKLYSHKFKQFIFGPGKTRQETFDEVTSLRTIIKNKKPDYIQSFDEFLENNEQEDINTLLSTLLFQEKQLDLLNARVFALQFGLALGNKQNKALIKKITLWAKNTITQLFQPDMTIDENFFLLTLLQLDYKAELIYALQHNFTDIIKSAASKTFFTLLQTTNKDAYNQIILYQNIVSTVKSNLAKEKSVLINTE